MLFLCTLSSLIRSRFLTLLPFCCFLLDVVMVTQQIGNARSRSNFWRTYKCISRYESRSAFTKGFFSQYIATILEERVRRFVSTQLTGTKHGSRLLPELAVILGHWAVYPLKLIRTRLIQQANHEKYAGMWDCFIKMRQEEGPLSLWSGMLLDTVRVVLGLLFNNWAHDALTMRVLNWLSPSMTLFAGLPAELVLGLVTFPLSTVVTKLQTQAANIPKSMRPDVEGEGALDCARKTVERRGVTGLWNGYLGFCLRALMQVSTVTALTHLVWKFGLLRPTLISTKQ